MRSWFRKGFFLPASLLLFGAFALVLVAAYSIGDLRAAPAEETKLAGGIKLSGFAPGTKITYQARADEGTNIEGELTIGEEGLAELPALSLPRKAPAGLVYSFTIAAQGPETGNPFAPARIVVRLDEDTGNISLKGSGFRRFSDLKLIKNDSVENTKTDWAGFFDIPQAATANELSMEKSFKLAFQDFGTIKDAAPERSSIVEVQVLNVPGVGGGPTSLGVNEYSPTGCNGETEHSICDEDHIDRTIEDIVEFVVTPLIMMGEQLSAAMFYHTQIIGHLLDAKIQLEFQSKQQELRTEAVKDYHPSEMMCRFGSFIKSVAPTEEKAQQNKQALNRLLTERYRNNEFSSSSEGYDLDVAARLDQFRRVYCDPYDNNNGLNTLCDHDGNLNGGPVGGTDPERLNKDINYTRTVEGFLTMDVDFTDAASEPDEEDVIALAKNLYWPAPFETVPPQELADEDQYQIYLEARRHMAARSVAHNSFVSIIGEKSRSVDSIGNDSGWAFMKAMMREFGLADADIHEVLGETPSYYAQMDFLTKKIYQHPQFYTNLYDKPANIERISASMDAIALMHSRDRFESALRREMLVSLMVEHHLQRHQEAINVELFSGMKESQR